MSSFFTYLWGGVARAAARCLQRVSRLVQVAESEVHDLQRPIVVDQQVLRLEVPVADAELVDVVDARDELLEVLAGLLFLQPLVLHDLVEELAAFHELHHQVQVLLGLDDLVDLHDVGVVQLLEDLDLATDALHVLVLFDA